MWYNVDYNKFPVLHLPVELRKPNLKAFSRVTIKPIDWLYQRWKTWRAGNIYKLQHTGQICYLRKALNDGFDIDLRRIYIGNGNLYNKTYIYTQAEAHLVPTGMIAENNTLYIRTAAETADTGYDFIVYVPQEIYDQRFYDLHALIQFYKAGGKRYTIMIIGQ